MKSKLTQSIGEMNEKSQLRSQSIGIAKKKDPSTQRKILSKKHCPQDQACFHCCQCWLRHKAQYQKRTSIFETKISNLNRQNDILKKCIQKLSKQAIDLKLLVKNTTQLEIIQENIRSALKKEMEEETAVNQAIQKEKIINLTEKLKQKQKDSIQIFNRNTELLNQISKINTKNQMIEKELQQTHNLLGESQRQKQLLENKNQSLEQQIQTLWRKITDLQSLLSQKTQNINKMKSTIDHSQKILTDHTEKISQKDLQKTKFALESRHKSQIIQKISQQNIENCLSIDLLKGQRGKLNYLIDNLNNQLFQSDRHQTILKIALNEVQYVARQKSISLSNLQHEVKLLKYTF